MNPWKLSLEKWIYILAFAVGLLLRFLKLGAAPLSDYEAGWALQALKLSQGSLQIAGSQPGYISLTGSLFRLFESSNFLARFWPAILGSILVLCPFLFRNLLGRRPALLLAFFLACDPALTAASRQADGRMLALVFTLLSLGMLVQGSSLFAGIFAGIALLGGPFIWEITLVLAIAAAWQRWIKLSRAVDKEIFEREGRPVFFGNGSAFLAGIVLSLLTVGTLFMLFPGALSATAQSLPEYFSEWVAPHSASTINDGVVADHSYLKIVAALFTGELFFLIFGGWMALKTTIYQSAIPVFLARWLAVSLLIVFLYPARQPVDLALVTVPLLALTAVQIDKMFTGQVEDSTAAWGTGLAFAVLLIFAFINLAGLTDITVTGLDSQVRLLSLVGAVALAILITLLVAWGWSVKSALSGSTSALVLLLAIFTFSSVWKAASLGHHPSTELWRLGSEPSGFNLLLNSIENTSRKARVDRHSLDIQILGLDSPALKWALRDFRNVSVVNAIPADAQPALILSDNLQEAAWGAAYTGQDFVLNMQPTWGLMKFEEWLRWSIFREAPLDQELLVMWVRSDLFPGGTDAVN